MGGTGRADPVLLIKEGDVDTKWGANASTIRTTALELSYYVAEYAAPVWVRSPQAQKLDTTPNSECKSVTGCLKPTNVEDLYLVLEMRQATSGEVYVLEWKIQNSKPLMHTLYVVNTL